ncbi:hypothetical protein L1987_30603 [Smallanthus sonchifolius]|uniref:Uncharacterized protein n=1 Tax=Smallanthus sonchifolius TaxID=185202 RepID=A0ACB9I4K6_9ASTR|nr:hypothetical protein L1987_30603 [Smallanthus sonchifolius]
MDSQNQKVKIIACTGGAWETVYGVLRYKPVGLPRRILQLPLNLTYSRLMTCVARKLNASLETGFRMTYQFPLSPSNKNKNVVVDIADDEDVEVFMDIALKTSHGLITLYVVEPVPSRRDQSDKGNMNEGLGKQHVFTYQHLFPVHETAHAAGTSKNPAQELDSEDDYGDENDLFTDQKGVNLLKRPGTLGVGGNEEKNASWLMPSLAPTGTTPRAPISDTQIKGVEDEPSAPFSLMGDRGVTSGVGGREAKGKGVGKDILWWMNPLPTTPAPDITPRAPVSCKQEKGVDRRVDKDMFLGFAFVNFRSISILYVFIVKLV